jgi:hypothetical protein
MIVLLNPSIHCAFGRVRLFPGGLVRLQALPLALLAQIPRPKGHGSLCARQQRFAA